MDNMKDMLICINSIQCWFFPWGGR